jgi:hypothetical protein
VFTDGKSTISLTRAHIERLWNVPLDTNHLLTIVWDPTNLKRAGDELAATIRATLRAEAKQTD